MQLRADFFNILNHPNFCESVPACVHCRSRVESYFAVVYLREDAVAADSLANGAGREVGVGTTITATGDVGIGNPVPRWRRPARHSVGCQVHLLAAFSDSSPCRMSAGALVFASRSPRLFLSVRHE